MKKKIKMWEKDIGMYLIPNTAKINRFNQLISKSNDIMLTKAEKEFNPLKHPLSDEARKRLKWIYIIHFECDGKIARASRKLDVSRTWLSIIHSNWIKSGKDPRFLEPQSKAPKNVDKRKKVSKEIENKIIEVRKEYGWGKDKLTTILDREHKIVVGASTVNRCLDKRGLLDIKISERLKKAHKEKVIEQKQKCRPPSKIKDYKPGALIEKDMKYVIKGGIFINMHKQKAKENFWYQHTVADSFTRIRTLGLAEDSESITAVKVQEECEKRLPFNVACVNTDNGSENEGDFDNYLNKEKIIHFYSRSGTPTDNPRVERSHLTDEIEFYGRGNIYKTFEEQKKKMLDWEYVYNNIRPHQALGNLTPMAFYELWKKNPKKAYQIAEKWKKYLKKQSERLANSRKMNNREKIARLMIQIDRKLANSYT